MNYYIHPLTKHVCEAEVISVRRASGLLNMFYVHIGVFYNPDLLGYKLRLLPGCVSEYEAIERMLNYMADLGWKEYTVEEAKRDGWGNNFRLPF